MSQKKIYLDHNATTFIRKEVQNTIKDFSHLPYNPSSVHFYGREAKLIVDAARKKLSNLLDAEGAQIIFTSSGTEANNLALLGFKCNSFVVCKTEHSSVLKTVEESGKNFYKVSVNKDGIVDSQELEEILKKAKKPSLVSIMSANNEIGTIQKIKEIAQTCFAQGAFLHSDAVQAVGKIKISFNDLNVDMMSVSGHKFGAPQGVGALLVKKGVHLHSILKGGGQERNYRPGTENVFGIHAFGIACESVKKDFEKEVKKIEVLRDYMENQILKKCPKCKIFAKNVKRLPNTSSIFMPNANSETLLIAFDMAGIMVSAGSACSSGKVGISHVLESIGASLEECKSSIRVSLGEENTKEDIEYFIESWCKEYQKRN